MAFIGRKARFAWRRFPFRTPTFEIANARCERATIAASVSLRQTLPVNEKASTLESDPESTSRYEGEPSRRPINDAWGSASVRAPFHEKGRRSVTRWMLWCAIAQTAFVGAAAAQGTAGRLFESPRLAQAPAAPPGALTPSDPLVPSDLAPQFQTGVAALDDPATFLPKRATELSVNIRPSEGALPEEPVGDYIGGAQSRAELYRGDLRAFTWKASGMHRTPTYFDDPRVERHGIVAHPLIQPAASAARFYATVPLLPALLVLEPPCHVRYCLGEGRWSIGASERFATPY